jgi:ketosteroid isomerase-like protein
MHRRAFAAALLIAATAACSGGMPSPGAEPSPAAAAAARNEITELLRVSADEWNRGSLDGFMVPYLDSPDITYIGTGVVRGKAAIRAFYASTWFRTGSPVGRLGYSEVEVRQTGPGHALSVGRWKVVEAGGRERTGMFSLTWVRTPQGWRIIHDHSS